jgi:molybdopterin-synthase adenylyltransferase
MPAFSHDELSRYTRQMILPEIGIKGQTLLKNSKVLVVGAGGLGCPVLQYLSAAGVGTLGIIDFDKIEPHNLHRQILFSQKDIGKPKAQTAAKILQELNPFASFVVYDQKLDRNNVEEILSQFEIVVDGSDNFTTRYLVNDACEKLNLPLVYGSIMKFEGQFAVFNYKGSKNLRDLFPEPPAPGEVPSCDENGVMGTLPAIIASMMAHETLKLVLEMKTLHNELVIFDTHNWSFLKVMF